MILGPIFGTPFTTSDFSCKIYHAQFSEYYKFRTYSLDNINKMESDKVRNNWNTCKMAFLQHLQTLFITRHGDTISTAGEAVDLIHDAGQRCSLNPTDTELAMFIQDFDYETP